jgi:hypothetical protein
MVATARILMPKSRVRLSAGREQLTREAQILCLLVGGDSIFYGDTLLTTANPSHADPAIHHHRERTPKTETEMNSDFQKTELYRLKEELFYSIDERQHQADLSEKGRTRLRPDNPDAFVLPDLATEFSELERRADLAGRLVIAPPSAHRSVWMKRFKEPQTAFVSGWMAVRGARRRRGYERGFVLSDHADWNGLLQSVRDSGARQVYVTHGNSDGLARYLSEVEGISAEPLAG